jgi:hypothetical protein
MFRQTAIRATPLFKVATRGGRWGSHGGGGCGPWNGGFQGQNDRRERPAGASAHRRSRPGPSFRGSACANRPVHESMGATWESDPVSLRCMCDRANGESIRRRGSGNGGWTLLPDRRLRRAKARRIADPGTAPVQVASIASPVTEAAARAANLEKRYRARGDGSTRSRPFGTRRATAARFPSAGSALRIQPRCTGGARNRRDRVVRNSGRRLGGGHPHTTGFRKIGRAADRFAVLFGIGDAPRPG